MRALRLLDRLGGMGAAAQASVPAIYAWSVTVAPAAWARGAPLLAKVAATGALVAIAIAVAGERRWGGQARIAALWGFVLASALAWSAAPGALGPLRVDAPRAFAGMLGWALFALTFAAPTIHARAPLTREEEPADSDPPLAPRRVLARGDALYLGGGALFAAWLQGIGWQVSSTERAVLVRIVTLAEGIALLAVSTQVALARHVTRVRGRPATRLRRAMPPLVALGLLALSGLLLALRD
jgi:hypothetical protein